MVHRGAQRAGSAREAVSDITLTVLPSSIEVRRAVFGEAGAFETMQPGMTFIDLSGTDPDCRARVATQVRGEAGGVSWRHDSRERSADDGYSARSVHHRRWR